MTTASVLTRLARLEALVDALVSPAPPPDAVALMEMAGLTQGDRI
jgi:hypothetical protein